MKRVSEHHCDEMWLVRAYGKAFVEPKAELFADDYQGTPTHIHYYDIVDIKALPSTVTTYSLSDKTERASGEYLMWLMELDQLNTIDDGD